jgi:hypothetical protein
MTADLVIQAHAKSLGDGVTVRRALPAMQRRLVGPFIFFDHLGPIDIGHGVDVRPHPHIALATITYLFEGALMHRDSLGSAQMIRPGDVNVMIAGRGIVHSERTPAELRTSPGRMHGIQTWVALPTKDEEIEPAFEHHAAESLPKIRTGGATLDVIAGTAYGETSKARVLSPTLYVHAVLEAGADLAIDDTHSERAMYVVEGSIEHDGATHEASSLVVLHPGPVRVRALGPTRLMLVGGAPLDGPRHIDWNFVSSSKERIEKAKADWREDRFPKVPGDEHERIPLPG